MKERAIEWLGETRKRIGSTTEIDVQIQKTRRSGEMMEWLKTESNRKARN